ncbi:Fe2+-dependent dioxygenase [Acinetobacter schindleri]|uniref:Fe2+-dependent dioxygenase n=1 Tax=Acinetobacter schindleri TaxID=108981 RepID=UPI002009F507|nr:Fe2+-dependent dioxygenase [Acinetobacter schindleri]MCK8640141.1 Fe2+-dependent dioxygenase [Acinetobacter schindleri]
MMLHIPAVLSKLQVAELRQQLDTSEHWINGQLSAGSQAQKIKKNLQLDSSSALYQQISPIILEALKKHHLITSAALPKHILPPLFNCYQDSGNYGNHVDNAIHYSPLLGQAIRTDVSLTLFLSEIDEYEGGELVVEDQYGCHEVKLDAGDVIVYPSTSLHRVEPVTQGKRIAAVTWIQSMVREDAKRSMLFDLDMTIIKLRQQIGDTQEVLQLTHHYHNLIRQWGDL